MANNVDIRVRAKDMTAKAWASAKKRAASFKRGVSKSLGGIASGAKKAAAGIALVSAAAFAAGKKLVGMGSNAEEITTKFEQVYKTVPKVADAIANDLAKSFDLADSTAKQMLGDTGDLLTGFGFAGEEALGMSDKVNRLAIDLASYTNYSGGAAGASQALTKLLLGETEQAKSLGIVVRQGSEEYKSAVAAKQKDLGVSLLQAKAMTALEMAYAQSKNAVGDYERTQEGVANRTRKASEAFKEAGESLGQAISESTGMAEIIDMVATKVQEFSESGYIDLWAANFAKAINFVKPALQGIGRVIGKVRDGIATAAAFVGALSGGASMKEAAASAGQAVELAKADKAAKLAAIREEKAAKKAAHLEEMEGRAVQARALEKQQAGERQITEEKKKQAAAVKEQAKLAKEAEKAEKKRLNLEKQLAKVKAQQVAMGDQDQIDRFGKRAEKNGADIEKWQGQIAGIAMNKEQRRAKQLEERQAGKDDARERRLLAKEGRGTKLGKDDAAWLQARKLQNDIEQAQRDKKIAEENARLREQTRAEDQRKEQIAELVKTRTLLEQNLKAG